MRMMFLRYASDTIGNDRNRRTPEKMHHSI